jgi:4-amino-4-deoxy-L-arabinose transferase-like glycosyltransferase
VNAQKLLSSAALAILLVCGSLSSLIGIRIPLNYYDEGLTLLNATRVMQGDIPYRDFWTLYAPGHFYALAALFRVVGPNTLAARILDTLCRIALSLLVYLVGKRMTSRWAAVVPYALVTLWVGAIGFYSYPIFPALALCLSVLLGLFRYMDTADGAGWRWPGYWRAWQPSSGWILVPMLQ